MNEHGYIRAVHKKLPRSHYRWKINDPYTDGVADAFYSARCGVLFIEYKYINDKKLPKRDRTMIVPDLSGLQRIWLRDRHEEGVPVAVVVGSSVGGVCFVNLSWETGIPYSAFKHYALQKPQVVDVILDHCLRGNHHVTRNTACYHAQRQGECQAAA